MSETHSQLRSGASYPRWRRWLLLGLTTLVLAAPAVPVSTGQWADQPELLIHQAECQDDHCS